MATSLMLMGGTPLLYIMEPWVAVGSSTSPWVAPEDTLELYGARRPPKPTGFVQSLCTPLAQGAAVQASHSELLMVLLRQHLPGEETLGTIS